MASPTIAARSKRASRHCRRAAASSSFRAAKTFRKADVLYVDKSHVKLWAPNREATIYSQIAGLARHSGVIFRNITGGGIFGVRFTSDATARFDALEDNQIATDGA